MHSAITVFGSTRTCEAVMGSALRYTTVAIVLHWSIAALILFNIAIGLGMEGLPRPLKDIATLLHFSCGITVLALTALRIFWRLGHQPPPLVANLAPWERAAAHAAHGLLYVLMIAMPLTGWSIISAHPPRPQGAAMIWGLLGLPAIAPISHLEEAAQKAAHSLFVNSHVIGGWILICTLILHVAGALKHQWFDREAELARMGIGRAPSGDHLARSNVHRTDSRCTGSKPGW
jgi:cytochrome b561